jgi:putative NIF3 family GTP cyclohydrolase 1 type 2
MTVKELYARLLEGAPWVDPQNTPDGPEYGDPDKQVRRVGVGWSACTFNLAAAAADGCDLFITHEPCFCDFWEPGLRFRETDWGRARARILQEAGMALMALHDVWDVWPTYGIGDSWAAFLGLRAEDRVGEGTYRGRLPLALYRVPPTTLEGYARHVAGRVRRHGQHVVGLMGDPARHVERVAVGIGCAIPEFEMLAQGADALVQVFDRAYQTFTRLPLLDLGAGLIVVEHGAAEMPGMENLARYLNETFPGVHASFYRREPDTRLVTP